MRLFQTIHRIEKSVYGSGVNVALYNAERSHVYIGMENRIKESLYRQVDRIADEDVIDDLFLFTKAKGTSGLVVQIGTLLSGLLLKDKIDFATYLVWAGTLGGQAAMDKAGIDIAFNLTNRKLINYFDEYSRLIINSVDDYTKEWIADQIQAGKDQGLLPEEIARNLIEGGKGISRIRAERIVLTETAKAMVTVEMEANKKAGFTEHTWRTSLDERVCPICLPLDGETVDIDDDFIAGVEGPPAHVNCRCFTTVVIPDGWDAPDRVWNGS